MLPDKNSSTRGLEFARAAGYESARPWTNHPLAAARRIYRKRGFRLIEEAPHHSFGAQLVGQVYELDLLAARTSSSSSPQSSSGDIVVA